VRCYFDTDSRALLHLPPGLAIEALRVPEILAPFLPKIMTLRVPDILAVLSQARRVTDSLYSAAREGMIDMLKRHQIQVLGEAGHSVCAY